MSQLLAETEDHQQRIVDRDAETDERDQELDDERDVRHVGHCPDQREGVEDRRDGDEQRHRDRRQRAEDEEQDDQRSQSADQRLEQDARPVRVAPGRVGVERIVARQVRLRSRRRESFQRRARRFQALDHVEARIPRRKDLGERRVPVGREVHRVVGREVVAVTTARVLRRGLRESLRDAGNLRHVAAGRGDDADQRELLAASERVQRPLVRLVRRVARDRELLEPAVRDAHGGVGAEDGEGYPQHDHDLPAPDDGPGQAFHPEYFYTSRAGLRCTFTSRSRDSRNEVQTASCSPSSVSAPISVETPSAGIELSASVFARTAAPINEQDERERGEPHVHGAGVAVGAPFNEIAEEGERGHRDGRNRGEDEVQRDAAGVLAVGDDRAENESGRDRAAPHAHTFAPRSDGPLRYARAMAGRTLSPGWATRRSASSRPVENASTSIRS